jgi:hypothetical protein
MKRLTLHRLTSLFHRFIASSLHRFIASSLHRFIASSLRRFVASSLHRFIASSLHCCQHYINPCRNRQINRAKLSKTYVKAKTTMFFGVATEIKEITNFFWKLHLEFIASKR